MKKIFLLLTLVFVFNGCATEEMYNPVASANRQTFLLNETSFAQVKIGMIKPQVHQIMGDSITIGYSYQKPLSNEAAVLKSSADEYKPLTIVNPYKTEDIKTKNGSYIIEYYVSSVKQPDGVISDEETVPFIFH